MLGGVEKAKIGQVERTKVVSQSISRKSTWFVGGCVVQSRGGFSVPQVHSRLSSSEEGISWLKEIETQRRTTQRLRHARARIWWTVRVEADWSLAIRLLGRELGFVCSAF